jgi:hypothetical protein
VIYLPEKFDDVKDIARKLLGVIFKIVKDEVFMDVKALKGKKASLVEFTNSDFELIEKETQLDECLVRTDLKYLGQVKRMEQSLLNETKRKNKIKEEETVNIEIPEEIEKKEIAVPELKLLRSKSTNKIDMFYEVSQSHDNVLKPISKKKKV